MLDEQQIYVPSKIIDMDSKILTQLQKTFCPISITAIEKKKKIKSNHNRWQSQCIKAASLVSFKNARKLYFKTFLFSPSFFKPLIRQLTMQFQLRFESCTAQIYRQSADSFFILIISLTQIQLFSIQ